MIKVFKFLTIIVVATSLTGCWDSVDINKRDYVLTLGIDKYTKYEIEEEIDEIE